MTAIQRLVTAATLGAMLAGAAACSTASPVEPNRNLMSPRDTSQFVPEHPSFP
jgi:hypothetical protein